MNKQLDLEYTQKTLLRNRFVRNYLNEFESISKTINKVQPDYILALSRKAPRLLELMELASKFENNIPIITEKSLDFIPSHELESKRVVIFDDIVILGSTIERIVTQFSEKYNSEIVLLCLAIDKDTIKLKKDQSRRYYIDIGTNNNTNRIYLDCRVKLGTEERYIFCNDIVRCFTFLNKPYDVDYPIFYKSINSKAVNRLIRDSQLDKVYNITTVHQHDSGYNRYTCIPKPNSPINDLFTGIFERDIIDLQICKERVYLCRAKEEGSFVPIVTFAMNSRSIENTEVFSNNVSCFNRVINKAITLVNQSRDYIELNDIKRPLYRIIWFLVNYIYGYHFLVKNLCDVDREIIPSRILKYRDICYLFGPSFAKDILNILDSGVKEVNLIIDSINSQLSEEQEEVLISSASKSELAKIFDKEREELYEDIKTEIEKRIRQCDSLTDKIASIFEAFYYVKEVPTQQNAQVHGINSQDYRRLKVGFNFDQIKNIVQQQSEITTDQEMFEIQMSLTLDFIVDGGIQIPIFYYDREDGYFERAYRYGEDALSAKKYAYLIASVVNYLFHFLSNSFKDQILPKITFEKIGVFLQEEIVNSGMADILHGCIDLFDSELNISPAYMRHGKVLHISEKAYEDSKSYPLMFSAWCEKIDMINYVEGGVSYNEEFLKSLRFPDRSMPKLETDDCLGKLKNMAILLTVIDRIVDKSKESNYLIALTACAEPTSYCEAIREELRLFFESRYYGFQEPLKAFFQNVEDGSMQDMIKLEQIKKQLNERSRSAAHATRHKKNLWDCLNQIVRDIEEYFHSVHIDLEPAYEQNLKKYLVSLNTVHDEPMEHFQVIERFKLEVLGEICILLSDVFSALIELSVKMSDIRMTKAGELDKRYEKSVVNRISKLYQNMINYNEGIEFQKAKSLSGFSLNRLLPFKEIPYLISPEYDVDQIQSVIKIVIDNIRSIFRQLENIYHENFSLRIWEVKRGMFEDRYAETVIERQAELLAIEAAKRCKGEPNKICPKVGAVIIKDGNVLCEASRGEYKPGEHAEYTALIRKCKEREDLNGATLVTTLEPCTRRHFRKTPCAELIKNKGIRKVIIGMVDPNNEIIGKGMYYLQSHGIEIRFFHPTLQEEVKEMNKDFIEQEERKYMTDLMHTRQ